MSVAIYANILQSDMFDVNACLGEILRGAPVIDGMEAGLGGNHEYGKLGEVGKFSCWFHLFVACVVGARVRTGDYLF